MVADSSLLDTILVANNHFGTVSTFSVASKMKELDRFEKKLGREKSEEKKTLPETIDCNRH